MKKIVLSAITSALLITCDNGDRPKVFISRNASELSAATKPSKEKRLGIFLIDHVPDSILKRTGRMTQDETSSIWYYDIPSSEQQLYSENDSFHLRIISDKKYTGHVEIIPWKSKLFDTNGSTIADGFVDIIKTEKTDDE